MIQSSRAHWWRALVFTPYAWITLVLLLTTLYTFLQTDDFCTFARLHRSSGDNPLIETWHMFTGWTGRYSASFTVAFVGWLSQILPTPLQQTYALALAFFIAAFGFTCIRLPILILEKKQRSLPLGLICLATILSLMPSKLEGIFWLTGVAVYSIGLITLLLLFQSIATDTDSENERSFSYRTVFLIILTVGFNEFIGIAVGVFLALRFFFYARTRIHLKQNVVYFCTFVASFTATIFAPGNFVRDATITKPRHQFRAATDLSIQSLLDFYNSQIAPSLAVLILLLLAAFVLGWLLQEQPRKTSQVAPTILTLLGSFPIHFWLYAFLTGEAIPGRVINQAYAMALLALLLAATWYGTRQAEKRSNTVLRPYAYTLILVAGCALVASEHVRNLTRVTWEFGPTWRSEQVERDGGMRSLSSQAYSAAWVRPFSDESSSAPIFQGADVTIDKTNWINTCVADFYQVQSVQLNTTAPSR